MRLNCLHVDTYDIKEIIVMTLLKKHTSCNVFAKNTFNHVKQHNLFVVIMM